ncbi:cytochrome c oxidase polypeptide VIb [Salpingoeca rosetta]|uniref:Cytochrome c oxidase subunit n=1 Tax=Salpingoeca rosetta (strain ATCC 50818 / BSB-021) TaxID=946362 RepID=F2U6J0_SALR5|nr:cytochrome c oxidase polypeptide VIb [Salpingoeca rosetta]EGD83472.1 cytochrome c oxidase polypeptide VIb [Salpingoeca rosetta]|eukprot:XP_004994976.1 cytochrome c oxidase polypeptide VIb [Salpingoeca rosetta]
MADNFYTGVKKIERSDIKTAAFDARFPNTDQTKNCWQNYVDFHKCIKLKGEDYKPCGQFFRTFMSLCPTEWVEQWDEQREKNAFPHRDFSS